MYKISGDEFFVEQFCLQFLDTFTSLNCVVFQLVHAGDVT